MKRAGAFTLLLPVYFYVAYDLIKPFKMLFSTAIRITHHCAICGMMNRRKHSVNPHTMLPSEVSPSIQLPITTRDTIPSSIFRIVEEMLTSRMPPLAARRLPA